LKHQWKQFAPDEHAYQAHQTAQAMGHRYWKFKQSENDAYDQAYRQGYQKILHFSNLGSMLLQ
jgi:hypothetical protein